MNAKNKHTPPLPIQQAYRIQANPKQNNNFPIECQSKALRSGADLSNLQKLLFHKKTPVIISADRIQNKIS